MKKNLLLSLSLLVAAMPLCAEGETGTEQAAPQVWRFEKGSKARKIVNLLSLLAKPGADKSHVEMLGKAMESARTAAQIRSEYDSGSKTAEAVKQDVQNLVGNVADMLEFLALAKPLVEDSLRLSPLHDSGYYKDKTPLLLDIVELQRKQQEERLSEAVEDLEESLRMLDQIRAIRQGLIFNVPGKVKMVFGDRAPHLFDPKLF